MFQCKVDYLSAFGKQEHAIALFFWNNLDKEKEVIHVAFDADIFKKGTLHQIADCIESNINACLQEFSRKKEEGSNQETSQKEVETS